MKSKETRVREQMLAVGTQFEDLLAEVTVTLNDLEVSELDGGIDATLREIALFIHADGAFLVSADGPDSDMEPASGNAPAFWTWEAFRVPGESALSTVVSRETAMLRGMAARRERGVFPTAADVPDAFREVGVCSMAILPLANAGTPEGCLGVLLREGERAWSEGLLRRMWLLGDRLTAVLQRQRAARERDQSRRFERLLGSLAAPLGEDAKRAPQVEDALQSLAELGGGDRAVLFRVTEGGTRLEPEHIWADSTLEPADPEDYREEGGLRWLARRLADGEDVAVPDVSDLPEEAARERRHFRQAGCRSILRLPLTVEGRVAAVLGIDATEALQTWASGARERLRLAGRLLLRSIDGGRPSDGVYLLDPGDGARSAVPDLVGGLLPSLDRLPAGSSALILGDADRGREIVLRVPLAAQAGGASWEMGQAIDVTTAELPARAASTGALSPASPAAASPPDTGSLRDMERAHVIRVLEQTHWRINGARNAADRLGLKPSTLRYRMKKLGITRPATAL